MVTQQPPTLSLEEIVICTLSKFNRQDYGCSIFSSHLAIDIMSKELSHIYLPIFLQYLSLQDMTGGRKESRIMTIDLDTRCKCQYLHFLEGVS